MGDDVLKNFINKGAQRAREYQEIIEEMMGDGSYHYAENFLLSILDSIEETNNITDGQIQAVLNIKDKPARYGSRY